MTKKFNVLVNLIIASFVAYTAFILFNFLYAFVVTRSNYALIAAGVTSALLAAYTFNSKLK